MCTLEDIVEMNRRAEELAKAEDYKARAELMRTKQTLQDEFVRAYSDKDLTKCSSTSGEPAAIYARHMQHVRSHRFSGSRRGVAMEQSCFRSHDWDPRGILKCIKDTPADFFHQAGYISQHIFESTLTNFKIVYKAIFPSVFRGISADKMAKLWSANSIVKIRHPPPTVGMFIQGTKMDTLENEITFYRTMQISSVACTSFRVYAHTLCEVDIAGSFSQPQPSVIGGPSVSINTGSDTFGLTTLGRLVSLSLFDTRDFEYPGLYNIIAFLPVPWYTPICTPGNIQELLCTSVVFIAPLRIQLWANVEWLPMDRGMTTMTRQQAVRLNREFQQSFTQASLNLEGKMPWSIEESTIVSGYNSIQLFKQYYKDYYAWAPVFQENAELQALLDHAVPIAETEYDQLFNETHRPAIDEMLSEPSDGDADDMEEEDLMFS